MTRGNCLLIASLTIGVMVCLSAVGEEPTDDTATLFQRLPVDAPAAIWPTLADDMGCCPQCGVACDEATACICRWRIRPGKWLVDLAKRPISWFEPPQGRHRGIGCPLTTESWMYRPFSAGWFMGAAQSGTLIDDWVGMRRGYFGGYRLGWDENYYWGGEMRFSFGSLTMHDSARAIAAQVADDDATGIPSDSSWRRRFDQRRDANVFQWDVCMLYYPWGDASWRPYLLAGIGCDRTIFIDRRSHHYDEVSFAVPLGLGVKYRCNDWLALRFELADNIVCGNGAIKARHNLSINGGVEIRFGGSRTAYWPWNPGRHYW